MYILKINVENLTLDFYQSTNDKNQIQKKSLKSGEFPLNKIKKISLKLCFFNMTLLHELKSDLKLMTNLETLDLFIKSPECVLSHESWRIILGKTFPKLKNIKLTFIAEKGCSDADIINFFKPLKLIKTIESFEMSISMVPNVNLNLFFTEYSELVSRLKFLNKFCYNFLAIPKIGMTNRIRRKFGNELLKLPYLATIKSDDESINKLFYKKYRLLMLAYAIKKELRSTLIRKEILKEIHFLF